jgi:hypothetical protein
MAELNKKISFSMLESEKVEFKIRLQYDNLTQIKFFKAIVRGYLEKDEDLYNFINKFKKENVIQSKEQRKKIMTNIKQATDIKSKFALDDNEIENIFDILEQEHPDL